MSDPIRIHIQDHTAARTLEVTAPPETSVQELVATLRSRFRGPPGPTFRIFHRQGSTLLPQESTLMSIGPGDTLILVPTGGG